MSTIVSPFAVATQTQPSALRRQGTLAPLAIQPLHLISLLVCVLFFSAWLYIEAGSLPLGALVYFGIFTLSAYYLGRILLQALPLDCSLALSFVLILMTGSLAWALLLLAFHSFLPGSLPLQALLLFGLCIGGQYLVYRRARPNREENDAAWINLFVVFFSLAAATCWARGLLHSVDFQDGQVVFHHWMDYFDHAAFTSQLRAAEHLWQFGNFQISHLPTPLYHYGSYFYTACLADYGSLSSYLAVVAFWTPFGTFLRGLATFVLASSFGGRVAGLCALLALSVLPDASFYGLHNSWFGFHWLQQIGSAGMYALGCSSLALVLILEGMRVRSHRTLAVGLGAGTTTFFFKAQIFVVLMPLLVAWVILCYFRCSMLRRLLLLLALVSLALGAIVTSNHLNLGPRLEPSREYFEHYCKFVASESTPGRLRTWVEEGGAAMGRSRYYVLGIASILLSSFGVLLVGPPLLCLWGWLKRLLNPVDLVPWLAVALYVLFLVALKDNVIGLVWYELLHRPFVWVYFVLMVWSTGKACMLLRGTREGQRMLQPKLLCAVGLPLLFLPWYMGRDVQRGKTIWGDTEYGLRFPPGLVDCALFIARNGSRADCIQDSQCDDHLALGSLAERRSYLARPMLWKRSKDPAVLVEIERRESRLEQFRAAKTVAAVREYASQLGIRWYLLHPKDNLDWPTEILTNPAYCSNGFAVYDLGNTADP